MLPEHRPDAVLLLHRTDCPLELPPDLLADDSGHDAAP
jgi:hypothetical protein